MIFDWYAGALSSEFHSAHPAARFAWNWFTNSLLLVASSEKFRFITMSGRTGDRSFLLRIASRIPSWNSLRFGGTLSFRGSFLERLAPRRVCCKQTLRINEASYTLLKTLFSSPVVQSLCQNPER